MFILNGNRRPNVVAKMQFQNINGQKPFYKIYSFFNYLNHKDIKVDKKTFVDVRRFDKDLNASVDWISKVDAYDGKNNEILYTTTINDNRVVVNIYIVPKEAFLKKPQQDQKTFKAELNPIAVINDTRVGRSPIVKVLKAVINGDDKFFKSKTEAMYVVDGDESKLQTVEAVVVDGQYYEVKSKINIEEVDIYENRVVAYHERTVPKNKQTFSEKIEGLQNGIVLSKSFATANDGIYQVQGVVNGVIFVETIKSIVKGTTRTLHFVDIKSPIYKDLTKAYKLQIMVK